MKENEDAARIFFKVRGQAIFVFDGEKNIPIDLNHLAVWAMIDAHGIKDRLGVFEKVTRCWHELRKNEE